MNIEQFVKGIIDILCKHKKYRLATEFVKLFLTFLHVSTPYLNSYINEKEKRRLAKELYFYLNSKVNILKVKK